MNDYSKYKYLSNYDSWDELNKNIVFDNFIGIFNNILNYDLCDELIKKIHCPNQQYTIDSNIGPYRTDYVVTYLINQWSDPIIKSMKNLLSLCLYHYACKYPSITQNSIANTAAKLQWTKIGGGFHNWHHETDADSERIATWMIYLNDLSEDDGTTEFIYQHKKITPTKGTCVIWPAGYTHSHRGNPPYISDKYIATGWYIKVDSTNPRRELFSL